MNTFRSLSLLVLLITGSALFAQTETHHPDEQDFLVGEKSRIELQKASFGIHFMEQYRMYDPCRTILSKLENRIYNYSILIVLGTWCHDSHEQVPRFYKMLDDLDYNTNLVKNICVDKEKTGGTIDISELNIERVPTFIFYDDEKEIGRIIETPETSLEKDSWQILSN